MINLEEVKTIEWQYLVSRRESLLHRAILMECYDDCEEVTGMPWYPTVDFRPGPEIFFSRQDMQSLRDQFTSGGLSRLQDFCARLLDHVGRLDRQAKAWESEPPVIDTKEKLNATMEAFFGLINKASTFLTPMPIADSVISQNILARLPDGSDEEKQHWLKILAYPVKDNEHTKEERAFYHLVECFQKNDPSFDHLLDEHLREFAWIGSRGCWWNLAWTKDDLHDRIKQFFSSGKDPQEEARALEASRAERQAEGEALMTTWKIAPGSELDEWIKLAKEYAHIRTWRTDVIYGAEYRAGFIFAKIAASIGWQLYDFSYLTPTEIRRGIANNQEPISREELARRKEFFGTIMIRGELEIFSGAEGKKVIDGLRTKEDYSTIQELKGSIAFMGKAKGPAKVVFTAEDLKKVERGDVLVAVMTFPHFIAAMEKACAFVTDEGGILCHAAIVSREMRKPCVIATKHATKVFKDGDMVEVDAEKGIVRRISLE